MGGLDGAGTCLGWSTSRDAHRRAGPNLNTFDRFDRHLIGALLVPGASICAIH
jgi:hypothetical protein